MLKKENKIQEFWNWLWNSDSWLSYVVFLIIIFVVIKLIFFPALSLIFGTSLPLAIVESSSMDHNSVITSGANYDLCGKTFSNSKFFNLNEYWQECGSWYENKNITKEQFSEFKFKNGFRKGDIMIIFGKKTENLKIGDVLIFNGGSAHPIIHRIVSLNPLQTKGDHNAEQIGIRPDSKGIDETNIKESQIVGVAIAKIPYVGYLKIWMLILITLIIKNLVWSIIIVLVLYFTIKYALKFKRSY